MASKENKIVRRAQAMSELTRLSDLLAQQLKVEMPDVQATNRDNELAEIQRIENINKLLSRVLEPKTEPDEKAAKSPASKPVKHGTVK